MEGGAHSYRIKNFITMASRKRFLAFDSSENDTQPTTFTFKANENFAKYLVISSKEDKPITSLSPFIIEKQIESIIGTPKNVKKLKNGTLLVETNRKSQTDNLLKITKFFNINVTVTEHKTLNSCKRIIRDRMLKHETEENITEYLNTQGVTACKRFKIKKDGNFIETNTLLLTFNTTTLPKSLKKITELYRLKSTSQILCGVSTVRGLDIMKMAVLNYLDQYVKNVVWVTLITIQMLVKTKPSV